MNLIDAMRTEYGVGKSWLERVLLISFVLYGISIISVLFVLGESAKWLLGGSLLLQVVLFGFRYLSGQHFSSGENIRRIAMLQDGLGLSPSDVEIARIREKIGGKKTAEPDYLGPYYDSKSPTGPKRLVEIVEESAFFTSALSRRAAWAFSVVALVGLLVGVVCLIVIEHGSDNNSAIKFAVITMAFWATGDIASMACRFFGLSKTTERILDRCNMALKHNADDRDDAFKLFTEYNCAVVQAPPIPSVIYECQRNNLNEAWRNRKNIPTVTQK